MTTDLAQLTAQAAQLEALLAFNLVSTGARLALANAADAKVLLSLLHDKDLTVQRAAFDNASLSGPHRETAQTWMRGRLSKSKSPLTIALLRE